MTTRPFHPSTRGDWRVARGLSGDNEDANGRVVVCRVGSNPLTVIADCRNDWLPETEQRANARACAVASQSLLLLAELEDYLGDRPSSDKKARELHQWVVAILALAG